MDFELVPIPTKTKTDKGESKFSELLNSVTETTAARIITDIDHMNSIRSMLYKSARNFGLKVKIKIEKLDNNSFALFIWKKK